MPQQLEPAGQRTCSRPARMALSGMFQPRLRSTRRAVMAVAAFRLIAADQGQADAVQAVKIKGDSIQIPVLDGQPAEVHHGQRRVPLCRRTGDDASASGTPP